MKRRISISKITPPRLRKVIDRPRLSELLEKNEDKKLILVLGQAAQGKSTVAAAFITKSGIPSAWVNLRRDDSDPVNLFLSTIQALQYVIKKKDLSSLYAYPAVNMGPRLETPRYREWAHAVYSKISQRVRLVFDGLDRLDSDSPSFEYLRVMLEDAPRHFHFLMLSREMPPLNIDDLKIKREAYLIENIDLAFTQKEIRSFFKEIAGLSLSALQSRRILHFTEGWVGGLVLLSETLNRLSKEDRAQYISETLPAQFAQEVFQFFGEAIFSAQPISIQNFLIHASLFDTIDPVFMNELLGIENADDILNETARRNLFIETRSTEKEQLEYRFHRLFRNFLKNKFSSIIQIKEKKRIIFKAGLLYERRKYYEESMRCYLQAGAYDEAAHLINIVGLDLLYTGRKSDLLSLLNSFPEKRLQRDPWLIFYFSMTKRFTETGKNISRLKRAFTLFEKQKIISGQMLSLAYMIEASVFGGKDIIPIFSLLQKGEQLLKKLTQTMHLFEKAILYFQLGLGYSIRGGNLWKSLSSSRAAYLILKSYDNVPLQIAALANALLPLSFLGKFNEAENISKEIEKLSQKNIYQELYVLYLINLSAVFINQGKLDQAKMVIHSAEERTKRYGLIFCQPVIHVYQLMLLPHLDEYEAAENIGNQLLGLVSVLNNVFLKGAALMQMGMNYYFKGNDYKADLFLNKSRKVFMSQKAYSISHLIVNKIIRALVCSHLKKYESAKNDLEDLLDTNKELKSDLVSFHLYLAIALYEQEKKNTDKSKKYLMKGFQLAETNGFYHTVWMSKKDFCTTCCLVLEFDLQQVMAYASRLLVDRLSGVAVGELERLSQHPEEKIRKKADEIRFAIHRRRLPRLTIKTLGGFSVLQNSVPIDEKQWLGTQPKKILKSIIARGGQGVSMWLLIEDLWPESESGEKNFKAAIHRLRKSLEPKMDQRFGSSYIHLKENKLYLDDMLIDLDILIFSAFQKSGKSKQRSGDVNSELSDYKTAIDLYQGDFLPEEDYPEVIVAKRNELKSVLLDLLLKTARIYEDRGAMNKAISYYKRAVQVDPLLETLYQRLMILYFEKGNRNAALKTYHECRSILMKELGVMPEDLTTAIYQKIQK